MKTEISYFNSAVRDLLYGISQLVSSFLLVSFCGRVSQHCLSRPKRIASCGSLRRHLPGECKLSLVGCWMFGANLSNLQRCLPKKLKCVPVNDTTWLNCNPDLFSSTPCAAWFDVCVVGQRGIMVSFHCFIALRHITDSTQKKQKNSVSAMSDGRFRLGKFKKIIIYFFQCECSRETRLKHHHVEALHSLKVWNLLWDFLTFLSFYTLVYFECLFSCLTLCTYL